MEKDTENDNAIVDLIYKNQKLERDLAESNYVQMMVAIVIGSIILAGILGWEAGMVMWFIMAVVGAIRWLSK